MKKAFKVSLFSLITIFSLIVILILTATTQPVLKGFVIPILEKTLDARITTDSIYLSLLKGELKVSNFSYTANDNCYSINTKSLDLKVKLKELFDNKYIVNHLKSDDTEILINETMDEKNEKASINLGNESKTETDSTKIQSTPLYLDISNVEIKSLNFIYTMKRKKADDSSILKILDSNINIPKLKTAEDGQISYSCKIEVVSNDVNEEIKGSFKGNSVIKLDEESYPRYIKSDSELDFLEKVAPINILLQQLTPSANSPAPFTLSSKIENLALMPIFKAFLKGSYSSTKGCLNNLELNLSGCDIENIDFKKNLKGSLNLNVTELEVPTQLLNFAIAKIIFLPIYIIAHLNDYLAQNEVLPSEITNLLGISNDILAGAKEFNFRSGDVNFAFENGLIDIREFILKGGKGCPIREMDFSGYVDMNSDMNVRTQTNITGIIIPLTILGTLENPKPNVRRLLPGLLGKTAANLIKTGAELGIDLGKKITDSAGEFLSNIPEMVNNND